jgi:hypothetical protein
MCLECGFYNGRKVMDLAAQKDKRIARMQAKKEAIRSQRDTTSDTQAAEIAENPVKK